MDPLRYAANVDLQYSDAVDDRERFLWNYAVGPRCGPTTSTILEVVRIQPTENSQVCSLRQLRLPLLPPETHTRGHARASQSRAAHTHTRILRYCCGPLVWLLQQQADRSAGLSSCLAVWLSGRAAVRLTD